MRTFIFDDGQTWHVEVTRLTYQAQGIVKVGVEFWAHGAPDQRVLGRLAPRGHAPSDAQLADTLRQTLRRIARGATLDA